MQASARMSSGLVATICALTATSAWADCDPQQPQPRDAAGHAFLQVRGVAPIGCEGDEEWARLRYPAHRTEPPIRDHWIVTCSRSARGPWSCTQLELERRLDLPDSSETAVLDPRVPAAIALEILAVIHATPQAELRAHLPELDEAILVSEDRFDLRHPSSFGTNSSCYTIGFWERGGGELLEFQVARKNGRFEVLRAFVEIP